MAGLFRGRRLFFPSLVLSLAALFAPASANAAELRVMAAASLSEALTEVGAAFEAETGTALRFNFGASSTLMLQIRAGAKADVFLSADEAKIDTLSREELIHPGSRRSFLSNALVVVTTASAAHWVKRPQDLVRPEVKRIALAETQTVPAGIYARAYLTSLGLWPELEAKVIATDNVRGALAAVAAGNADAALVYATDVRAAPRIHVSYRVPPEDGPKISYSAVVLRGSEESAAGLALLEFLHSPPAMRIFEAHGFRPGGTADSSTRPAHRSDAAERGHNVVP